MVKPFASNWHFPCMSSKWLLMWSHPRHQINIQRRVKMSLRDFIKSDIAIRSIYLYEKGKNMARFVRHRYSLCLHFNHIFQAPHHRWSLWGRNLGDRKLRKRINLTFACGREKRGRKGKQAREKARQIERKQEERKKWHQGRFKEGVPPQRAEAWGENLYNESSQLSTHSCKTSDLLKSPKEGQ